jgi:probable O-glycosylation ligase (exosortase A-associated)
MRELLLLAVVGGVCVAALANPRLGLYGYISFALFRPDAIAWSENRYPYSLALAAATLLGSIRYADNLSILVINPIVRGFLLLQLPIASSVVFALEPTFSYGPYRAYLAIVTIALSIPMLIQTERALKNFIVVMALSMGLLAVKFALYGLRDPAAHFDRGWVGLVADNNDLALAFVMTLPLCWYARHLVDSHWLKRICWVMAMSSGLGVVMTRSRGGALSLTAVLLLMTLRAKHRVLGILFLSLVVGAGLYVGGEQYLQRLSTLSNPQADESAANRIYAAYEAIRVWQEHPWNGVGFGSEEFRRLEIPLSTGARPVAHNTYLEMLVDSGVFALLLYIAVLFGTIFWLRRSALRVRAAYPGMDAIPIAIQTSLTGFAIGATFLSRIGFDYSYFVLMSAASWWIVEQRLSGRRPMQVPSPECLLPPPHVSRANAITKLAG